jgi:uncharacterized protein (UPF0371 family)
MMDYFHFDKYEQVAVNYNRDLEMVPRCKTYSKKNYR